MTCATDEAGPEAAVQAIWRRLGSLVGLLTEDSPRPPTRPPLSAKPCPAYVRPAVPSSWRSAWRPSPASRAAIMASARSAS
jgi:hypothetical protein